MIREGALVAYRDEPAIVTESGAKLTVKTKSGAERKVRDKDVAVLHPGPISGFGVLAPLEGEIETARQMLDGGEVSLRELCELAYGEFTPVSAWAAWQVIRDGLYFDDSSGAIVARSDEAVARAHEARAERERVEERKRRLIGRIRNGTIEEADRPLMGDVEALARGVTDSSKTLRELGMSEQPERAHGLLLKLGVWDERENPYPSRCGVPVRPPTMKHADIDLIETLARSDVAETGGNGGRRDLTGLAAFAIDDEGTTAADDAVSVDDGRLWVHVADPAAAVLRGSEIDVEARGRGATLHAPERVAHMLPDSVIEECSLGNSRRSRALSFRLEVDGAGEIALAEIVPSWVTVTRFTYLEADGRLHDGDLGRIAEITARFRSRRMLDAAPAIELPEVRISAPRSGEIVITPLHIGPSRELVLESMLMAGLAIARHASAIGLAMPYSRQESPDLDETPKTLSGMWAARRRFKRSEHSTFPGTHAGLGLACYVQVTSPLRRYLDLLAHQQLRSSLSGLVPRDRDELTEAIGESDLRSADVRRAESLSNRHFTLAWLLARPDWRGVAVVVAYGKNTTVLVPELALEAELISRESFELDDEVPVSVDSIRLPTLECYLREA